MGLQSLSPQRHPAFWTSRVRTLCLSSLQKALLPTYHVNHSRELPFQAYIHSPGSVSLGNTCYTPTGKIFTPLHPYQGLFTSGILVITVLMLHRTYWCGHHMNKQGCSCILLPSSELTGPWNRQSTKGVLRIHLKYRYLSKDGPYSRREAGRRGTDRQEGQGLTLSEAKGRSQG